MTTKTRVLQEIGKQPGTVRELAERMRIEESTVAVTLTELHHRGQVTRVKVPQPKGRPVFQYSIADEAQPQA
jgi:predicted transcriptional regulator